MNKKWGSTPIEDARLEEVRRQYKYECEICGWLNVIYPFEKRNKKICKNCGNYVYVSKKEKFKDKLKESMK